MLSRPKPPRCSSLEALASNEARTLIPTLYRGLKIAPLSKACMLWVTIQRTNRRSTTTSNSSHYTSLAPPLWITTKVVVPFFLIWLRKKLIDRKTRPLDSRASADATLAPHTDWHINLCATVLLLLPFQKHCEERKQTCMDGSFTFKHILVSIVNWNVSDFVTDLNVSVARAEANADSSRWESKSLKRTV